MDNQTAFMVGVGAFFCTLVANRFLGERNYKQLSQDDKVKLIDQFSAHRSLATYIPIGIMGLMILVGRNHPNLFRWLFPAAIVTVLAVSITLQFAILRRLGTLGLPAEFVSRFRFQSVVFQTGNVLAPSAFGYGMAGIA